MRVREREESRKCLDLGPEEPSEDWMRPRVCFFTYLCLGVKVRIKQYCESISTIWSFSNSNCLIHAFSSGLRDQFLH